MKMIVGLPERHMESFSGEKPEHTSAATSRFHQFIESNLLPNDATDWHFEITRAKLRLGIQTISEHGERGMQGLQGIHEERGLILLFMTV